MRVKSRNDDREFRQVKEAQERTLKLIVTVLAGLLLLAAIGCAERPTVDLGDPYTADQAAVALAEDARVFTREWVGNRINITGVVDDVGDAEVVLAPGNVVLMDLSQEEQLMLLPGDEVEYACEVGDHEFETIYMNDCGPVNTGAAANVNEFLRYWSLPALLIASVLTVTAMARSTWRAWQPPMIALMCLGVLAILNDAATVVFGYTTVNTELLTPIAAGSFLVICVLAWIILNPDQFPALSGGSPTPTVIPPPTVQPPPDPTPPPPPPGSEATAIGGPSVPVAAAVPTPAQTMAMQPDVARSLAWLVVTRGPSEGKSLQLREGNNTIGRSLDNDLQIDDASVSRAHAMLSVKDDQFTLVDLGSASGTRIGDHRISGRQVGSGSVIVVGQTRLSLVSVDAFQGGASSGATMVGSPSGSSLSLVAQSGPDAGRSFLLTSAQNVIGRDQSAEVALSDPTVSRRHAMVRVDADRTTISDLGSQSGTQVDGEVVTGVQITVGERVVIGQSEFTLMRPSG